MAEIKSTLDLIMEKTKDMVLTEEEKEELRLREWTGKIRGLVQRYCDRTIDAATVEAEIFQKASSSGQQLKNILKGEILIRLEPEGDNGRLLELLRIIPEANLALIEKKMGEFHAKCEEERARRTSEIRRDLRERGVSGSAILPNLEGDSAWKSFREREFGKLRQTILDQER